MNGGLLLIVVAIADIALIALGVYGAATWKHAGWLSFAVAAVSVVTFFGFLHLGRSVSGAQPDSDRLERRAIAATAVVVYLVLVSNVAFFGLTEKPQELNPLTNMLVTNFTAVVGVIVAFYFGSSAYVEVRKP